MIAGKETNASLHWSDDEINRFYSAQCQSFNPAECIYQSCQECKFVDKSEQSTVQNMPINDVIEGCSTVPHSETAAWKDSHTRLSILTSNLR